MIKIPEGFDVGQLFADLFGLAAPFVAIAFLIGCYCLLQRLAKIL